MVQMRVGQGDSVNRVGWNREVFPVSKPQLLQTLKQPAIEEHPAATMLQQVFRAGHRARRPQKRQFRHPPHDIKLTEPIC